MVQLFVMKNFGFTIVILFCCMIFFSRPQICGWEIFLIILKIYVYF